MIGRHIDALIQWMKRVVTQPREELDRWQRAARFGYDLGRFGARQMKHDRAAQMAAALAFRALFGLVPVLVVITILVRAMIGIDEFLGLMGELLTWASLDQVQVMGPSGVGSQSLAEWLEGLVGEAASINLTATGWVGLVVVVYAAISLMTTIENAFNTIYRAHEGRPWTRRVPLYWFLLTVSPIAIGMAAWLNGQFGLLQERMPDSPWLLSIVSVFWSCLFGWTLLLGIYLLLPNAAVRFRPAAAGALVTVILFEIGKRVLGATLANAFSISQLYGSLGLIPLFMFWTYLMWLAVLFGLQVSATLQMLHGRRLEEIERRREVLGMIEPGALITVMEMIARRFANGAPTSPDELSETLGIRQPMVREMLQSLEEGGIIHRLEGHSEAVSLARPAEQITAAELIEIGFRLVDECGAQRSRLLDRLRDAQRSFASQQTLASLLRPAAP